MSSERVVRAVIINDPIGEELGLSGTFFGIDNFAAFTPKNFAEVVKKQPPPSRETNVHLLRSHSILFDPELRKLINESNGTFLKSRRSDIKDVDLRSFAIRLSHEHRSSIRQTIENLQALALKKSDEKYFEWSEIFDNIEMIWHLCELLHMDVPLEPVLPKLLEWIQFHSSECETRGAAILTEAHTRGAELRHQDYWSVVWRLMLQGRFEATRALLRLHSESDSDSFMEADFLLRTIPVYSVFCGLSISEFKARWKSWKATVRSKLRAEVFSKDQHLKKIMTVLGEEETSVSDLKHYCATWYELLCSVLLFSDPTVKLYDLSYHSTQCISHYGGSSSLKLFDYIILSIFDSDLYEMLRKLQLGTDGFWSAVHLGNLLDLIGYFTTNKPSNPTQEEFSIEFLFVDYALLMTKHSSLWPIGLSYLQHCPNVGRDILETVLPQIPLTNDKKAIKVAQFAEDNDLKCVANSIYKIMGMRYFKEKHFGNALTWALKSHDRDFASYIADSYLHQYAFDADLDCADTLKHLGSSVLQSPRLTFLAKYCRFHELYEEGNYREAAALLVALLDSKKSPKYFWLTLLSNALPLLHLSDMSVFSSNDMAILHSCLEELTTDLVDNSVTKNPEFENKTQIIRLAIAKYLSKALIKELALHSHDKSLILH